MDPWIRARGGDKFRTGLLGFHCAFLFDFDITQLRVTMNGHGGGRMIVDGVMNLRQIPSYTYPLRAILVCDFVLTQGGTRFEITSLEEMWSFADMIQNVPLFGSAYQGFRFVSGYFFTGFFWLSASWPRGSPGPSSSRARACFRPRQRVIVAGVRRGTLRGFSDGADPISACGRSFRRPRAMGRRGGCSCRRQLPG